MKYVFSVIISISFLFAQAQIEIRELKPKIEFENIHVKKLSSDSLVSTFAIWVKLNVKSHKHIHHTEHIYILEGKGNFTVADSTFKVKKGHWIIIPKNTFHSVEVTSKKPMKVLSIQAPKFVGEDRIFESVILE